MNQPSRSGRGEEDALQERWEDGERVFCRTWREDAEGRRREFISVTCIGDQPTPGSIDRLKHEYELRDHLDAAWALRPLDLVHERGQATLLLEPSRGLPLDRLIGRRVEVGRFLQLAVALSATLGRLHQRGLIHKDIKPTNIILDVRTGQIRLTGFGIASRLPRERQAPAPPEVISGTLAYMAPEQTGRMNRSIDSRSDLYALGVTFYEMVTGSLPFVAADPMEWVHCHIARQAIAPCERASGIPEVVSAIVMKLLAKTPEERYQTAAGVQADLRRCLEEWQSQARIEPFPVGAHDASDRLLITEELYGREREIDSLLASFDRVVTQGTPELVLVSGYSGVGKSSVVNELHKVLVPRRGLFAAGKFDQYKRDIPYATLAQAFQTLIRQVLVKSEAEVEQWRRALTEALGAHGQLIVNLVPDLEYIIGKQPAVPDLPPRDAQNRFQMVFRRFLGKFAKREHPLALFLDDLQWLDAATLDLIEHLVTHAEVRHLLLVGAYRDNEIGRAHPLLRTLEAIKKSDTRVSEIVLLPLRLDDVGRIAAGALQCNIGRARPLTQLVYEKTGGNPFFAIQFLTELAEEGLLAFDPVEQAWQWEFDRIHAKGYTDNVVSLMVEKLKRLPADTQAVLRQLACVGPSADLALLATVCQVSQEELHESLWEAIRSGLVHRSENFYGFQHDRIQEAAYSRIPEQARTEIHLQIGRLLIEHTPPDKREEIIFEIVSQFNRSTSLITSQDEREQLARLNLIAGKHAKNAVAYASALTHFVAGRALLAEDCWALQYQLTFELEFYRAECEFLTGDFASAEHRLSALWSHAENLVDQAAVACLRVDLYMVLGRSDQAVAVCLEYLQHVGIEWSPHPTDEDVRREYERIWQRIGSRPIEDLIDLPLMNDTGARATMDVLTKVMPSTQCTDDKLLCLVVTRMVNLSLEYGNTNASCCGYVWFGLILSSYFENYPAARRFGRLSLDLVDRRGLDAFKARVYEAFGIFVSPWTEHVLSGRAFVQQAFNEANRIGDITYAVYCCNNFVTNSLASGERLSEVEREARDGIDFALKADFGLIVDIIQGQLCLVRMLQGLTRSFNSFDDTEFDERKFEEHLQVDANLTIAACWYWIRKLQAHVFAQDYGSALVAADKAKALLWTSPAFFEQAEYHFYAALACAGSIGTSGAVRSDQQIAQSEALVAHHRQLRIWAEYCPENFENRFALVGAELARLEGRDLDAEQLYEQAVQSAHKNGFIHNEALANELAAHFYSVRGLAKIARMYLRDARQCYLRWGAEGKVRQLERLHPHLRETAIQVSPATATTGARIEELDVRTMLKASQAISGEIVLGSLIETLMRIAVEHAGAERGVLILLRNGETQVAAEAVTHQGPVEVTLRETAVSQSDMPEPALHFVVRTRESLVLDDASESDLLTGNAYLQDHNPKSVLCLPITRQTKLVGVLYLENSLSPGVFTTDRVSVLEFLAAQAAISLENTYLYSDLQRSEAFLADGQKMSRTGTWRWNLSTGRLTWSDEHCRIFGYDPAEKNDLTFEAFLARVHPDDVAEVRQRLDVAVGNNVGFAFDFRLSVPDGSVRYVHGAGGPVIEESRNTREFAGTTIDITERKIGEDALRNAQADLARVARLATMGELTTLIAHEVSQPLMAIVANADACLAWLKNTTPNLDEARRAAEQIVRNGHRAGAVIKGIRALARKAEPEMAAFDINDAIGEILALIGGELHRQHVSLETELSEDLGPVVGDRVQVQQVVLNLIVNGMEAMTGVMDRPRTLRVISRPDPSGLLIVVADVGTGLDSANMDRIFDGFFTTKPGGIGMGLAISRSIVEAHGGALWAIPNQPHGSIFQFTMPGAVGREGRDDGL